MRVTDVQRAAATLIGAASLLLVGCSLDGILKNEELPPTVTDPALTQTPEGAIAAYYGALAQFRRAFDNITSNAGLLSDELQPATIGADAFVSGFANADTRTLPEGMSHSSGYEQLQRARGQAGHAIGLLQRYAPDSAALAGHLYAIQAYAEVFLGELFCSGIPLSTLDFDGDYTYKPGSTTREVYEHALALFDTALTVSTDSARFLNLARVGRARALLGLGDFVQAAAAVAEVPDGYRYTVSFITTPAPNFAFIDASGWAFTVSDREGFNGLDYISSDDPRTAVTARGVNGLSGATIFHPNKYDVNGSSPIVLADWVEARLIEAEAALRAGDVTTWLGRLNRLRQTAITPALADLADPSAPEARIDLLFRERAFWLFLTEHRQGDLRRLIRQYGRPQQSAYPSGPYPGGGNYGGDVTFPLPPEERLLNPLYSGCFSRGA